MTAISRRSLLAGSFAAAVGAAAAPAALAEEPEPKAEHDFIIVGAGCGGLVCAIRAAELGLKPLLIEKMSAPAGNTIYSAGIMLGVNTKMQQGKNLPPDSVEKFLGDMQKMSLNRGRRALNEVVATRADKTLEWMQDYIGVQFRAGAVLAYPMLGRAHFVIGKVQPGGTQLAMYLLDKAKALGVELRYNTKAIQLLTDGKTGAVVGVKVKGTQGIGEIRSRYGVVLATGGYSGNQALVTQYCGHTASVMPIRGSHVVAGENLTLTAPLSAKLVNVDQYHCGPIHGPTGANPLNIVNNGICVSIEKTERYVDEGLTYVQMSRDTAAKTSNNWGMMILDQTAHDLPFLKNDWASYARCRAPVYVADTIEELAKKAGLDPAKLAKIVKEYNEACDNNTRDKLVPPNTLPKAHVVKTAPFYAVPFQGGMTATFGGPLINTSGQVLDTEERPIEGLFAIGNAAGGLFYNDYIGGNQLTGAAVYGCVVAEFVKAKKEAR